MLKKYQVLELEDGNFMVAFLDRQQRIGDQLAASVTSSNSVESNQFNTASEAQELADELNGACDE